MLRCPEDMRVAYLIKKATKPGQPSDIFIVLSKYWPPDALHCPDGSLLLTRWVLIASPDSGYPKSTIRVPKEYPKSIFRVETTSSSPDAFVSVPPGTGIPCQINFAGSPGLSCYFQDLLCNS